MQLGADVEQMDTLSRRFNDECDAVEQLVSRVTNQIQQTWWQGQDADRFRTDWEGTFSSQLKTIAQALRDTGKDVQTQAAAQRQVSQ